MPLRSLLKIVGSVVVVACCFSATVPAATPNRLSANITMAERVPLAQTVHPMAMRSTDLGPVDPGMSLTELTLRFSLSDAQQAALTELLLEQQQPGSANYHKWLTPEQYGAQFGMSAADLAKVSAWLTSQGFTVTGTARGGNFITFSGTAAQVERAFATTIHNVSMEGETHFTNLSDPALPAALSGVVSGLSGLHNFKLVPRAKTRLVAGPEAADGVHPQFTSSVSGNHYIAPGDFYTIYDENSLLSSSINGSGVTIAVMGQTDISLSDVAAFRAASGLVANVPTVKVYGNDPGTSSDDLDEAQLDVEWSGAAAPSANIIYVNSSDVINTSLTQAINNSLAPILTISYGLCEPGYSRSQVNTLNALFQQANAQGMTIVGPGGDSGAADCDYSSTSATQGLAVDFPASSPFVTGVGGTMFNEGSGTYFAATNNSNAGSAISYIPEAVWNETAAQGKLAAGGGGASVLFAKPIWQTGTGVPADNARDVPDISFDSAVVHDGFLFCSRNSCTNGFRNSDGFLNVVGGTSIATPSFAGIVALIEQKTASRVGNANPTIYALANSSLSATIFHDVTTGNNAVPCTRGTTGCANGGSIGYNATAGYDLATGWGSIDIFNLVNNWSSFTGSTTTTVTTTTPAVVAGGSIVFTTTVASSSAMFTTAPSGIVQVLIDGVASGYAATLSSGTATITLSTSGVALGTHTITAAYLGGTSYAKSNGTTTITVNPSSASIASVTNITPSATAVMYGATVSLPVTVSSGAAAFKTTPSGSVQLRVDGTVSGSPVTLVSGTATFQFSTSSLTTGAHIFSVVYSGDSVYLTSTGTTTINIGDFSLTGSASSVTVRSGAAAAGITYTVASLYNFSGTVSLSATSSSLSANYSFVPTTVTLSGGGSGTSVFTLVASTSNSAQSIGSQASNKHPNVPWIAGGAGGVALAGLMLVVLPERRRRMTRAAGIFSILLLSAGAVGLTGCGSSGSSSTGTTSTNTATGTYVVTITAASGTVSHVTTLTVIVQ